MCVNPVCNLSEIFRTVFKVHVVSFDYKHFSRIFFNPLVVSLVKIVEILDTYALFVFPSAFLDLGNRGKRKLYAKRIAEPLLHGLQNDRRARDRGNGT